MTIKQIKKRIQEKGIKKKKLAENIGVSDVMLSYFLHGQRNLSEEKFNALIKELEN